MAQQQIEFSLKPVNVLKGALEILSDEKRWCKGSFARDSKGELATATSSLAESFCILGAFRKVANDDSLCIRTARIFCDANKIATMAYITVWNDTIASHSDVVNAIKKAISGIENV